MDSFDKSILELLQKNARMTASEIGGTINLSVSAVSERLKKLETTGIISQYTTILNSEVLHKSLTAIIFVSLDRPKYIDSFIEFVKSEDEILECHYLAGDFDYALKVLTESTSTLEKVLNKIKSVPGVHKTKTTITLSTVKNVYSIVP